ncbi:MAG TPA: hypothetical protein VFM75_09760 [Modicisalibacter sp.]|nr:hypothetical protein [Modicisalibacter sp.]
MSHKGMSSSMSRSMDVSDRLARGLGWFSIGLGLFELFAPRKLTNALGLQGRETLVRACGAREIVTGIGALSHNPTPAIWSRVGGDAMDLATLTPALKPGNPKRDNALLAVGIVLGAAAVDIYCAQALTRRHKRLAGPTPDYSHRSGFSQPAALMRGAASDFATPADMRAELPMPRYEDERR